MQTKLVNILTYVQFWVIKSALPTAMGSNIKGRGNLATNVSRFTGLLFTLGRMPVGDIAFITENWDVG